MTRKTNPPGTPFNFDFVADLLFPNLWKKEIPMKFRGAAFISAYSISVISYFSVLIFPIAIFLSRPLADAMQIIILFGIPIGFICGAAAWWDFHRRN